MVEDMVMRRMLQEQGQPVAHGSQPAAPRRLPAGPAGRAAIGSVLLLALSAGAALGGTAPMLLALGAAAGIA